MALMEYSARQRAEALKRLRLATREKPDPAQDALYIEDTAGFSTEVFAKACRRLETSAAWFPKLAELIEECRVVTRQQEANKGHRRELAEPPVSPEKVAHLRQMVEAAVARRRMK